MTRDFSSVQPAPQDRASTSKKETESREARKLAEFTKILLGCNHDCFSRCVKRNLPVL